MKKSITLIEVLVSVMLISVVITAILQIKENNLYFLEKIKNSSLYNSYISLVSLTPLKKSEDKKIYLSDEVDFADDDIRKVLKEIKIERKTKDLDPLEFKTDEYNLKVNIFKTTLTIENKITTNFYRFALE